MNKTNKIIIGTIIVIVLIAFFCDAREQGNRTDQDQQGAGREEPVSAYRHRFISRLDRAGARSKNFR
jgi:hypothetical protein